MTSDAVGLEIVSRVTGYKVRKGNFAPNSPNLPQRIIILGEGNQADQATMPIDTETEITSAKQAGEQFGFGSPIHSVMRILRPPSGGGVGGIPTIVIAQAVAAGATGRQVDITPSGTATGTGTHTVVIAGRTGLDGVSYDFVVNEGDTVADVCDAITAAINGVLSSPASAADNTTDVQVSSKWKGLTSQDLEVEVKTNGFDIGITYATAQAVAGSGTPSISTGLNLFENDGNTIVVNCYGTVTSIMDALEAFNGIADPETPTGRYAGTIFKPFVAFTGSTADDPSSITDTRKNDMTISIAPAPGSDGLPYEAAANVAVLEAPLAQNNPHLDTAGQAYPDMPTPEGSIGTMADFTNRDAIVKKGCSTVDKVGGRYVIQDLVTTYHPVGEVVPQFRYVRNLIVDWNIRFKYRVKEEIHVDDHVITSDSTTVDAPKVIKPKGWKAILANFADELALDALQE